MATLSYSSPPAPPSLEDIAANVAAVRAHIAAAAQRAGRSASDVTLVAVSKTVSLDRLRGIERAGIAELGEGDEELRTTFRGLKALRAELAPAFAGEAWRHLSMGMTDDYELAVEEGATLVRVGRTIFGERPPRVVGVEQG